MKTLIVGDIHNKWSEIEPIVESKEAQRIVFLGDYVNDWNSLPEDEIASMQKFHDFVITKRKQGIIVDVLLGNHDLPYYMNETDVLFPKIFSQSPGFMMESYSEVHKLLRDLDATIATVVTEGYETFICSHAGINRIWLRYLTREEVLHEGVVDVINSTIKNEDWDFLWRTSYERGGYDFFSSPLWCGLNELLAQSPAGVGQIVGHTPVPTITRTTSAAGTPLIFCDTFSTTSNNVNIGDKETLILW